MKKRQILIVEDELIIAESIKRVLEKNDYSVCGIITFAEDAIEFVKTMQPDLILMDILLEGKLSGLDAANLINKEFTIPIVFLTSFSDQETLANAVKAKAHGYILKPFSDRELLTNLQLAFYKYEMEQNLKNQEQFLKLILNHNPNPIYVKDERGNFILVNDSHANLYNLSPEEIIGKNESTLLNGLGFNETELQTINSEDKHILHRNFPIINSTQRLTHKNKEEKFFQLTKMPITLPNQQRGILGVAVDITRRKMAEDKLKKSIKKLQSLLRETVNGLVTAMEMRDPYTAGHQRRVAILATEIAKEMKLDEFMIDGIQLSALIHDIGKMSVPAEILSKPGKLTSSEIKLIRYHPEFGYEILKSIDFPWPVAKIVLQHHERIDGSGYPNGLVDKEILLEAKIIAVSDLVEAMASYRPFRPAIGLNEALNELKKNTGILYDPDVVNACIKVLKNNPLDF